MWGGVENITSRTEIRANASQLVSGSQTSTARVIYNELLYDDEMTDCFVDNASNQVKILHHSTPFFS
jgi:hypothetical protein